MSMYLSDEDKSNFTTFLRQIKGDYKETLRIALIDKSVEFDYKLRPGEMPSLRHTFIEDLLELF